MRRAGGSRPWAGDSVRPKFFYFLRLAAAIRVYSSTLVSVLPSRMAPLSIIFRMSESFTRRNSISRPPQAARLQPPVPRPQTPSWTRPETGTGIVLHQRLPLFCAVAGLFRQLALGACKRVFARIELAGRQLPQVLVGGMTVLPLDHDPWILPALRRIHGHDDHAAVVADHVALVPVAAGLNDLVVENAEQRPV